MQRGTRFAFSRTSKTVRFINGFERFAFRLLDEIAFPCSLGLVYFRKGGPEGNLRGSLGKVSWGAFLPYRSKSTFFAPTYNPL